MKKSFIRALSALTLALLAHASFATPITAGSQLSTGGILNVIGGDGSVANATGLDFVPAGHPVPGTDGEVTGYMGNFDLAAFVCAPGAYCATISDIQDFATFNADAVFLAAIGAPTFSFSLNAPLTITRVAGTPTAAAALIVSGSGIFTTTGFDPTNALFTLVTLNNTDGATTYSATIFALGTAGPNPMPEPGSVLLMGLGVAGLLAARRKPAA